MPSDWTNSNGYTILNAKHFFDDSDWDIGKLDDTYSQYGARSFACSCQQKLPQCIPKDGWEVESSCHSLYFLFFFVQMVVTCDNRLSAIKTDCSYEYTLGTTYSNSITESMSVSSTISADIGLEFESLFSASVSSSLTTGYDFARTYDFSQSVSKAITVETSVEPGERLL